MNVLAEQEWVLIGAGHTHLHILNMWKMHPVKDVRLTCISNYHAASYSGMLPGVLAGDYDVRQMHIDLVRQCAAVGARLILGHTLGLDRKQQIVFLRDRTSLRYNQLSIGIGSVPPAVEGAEHTLSIKPMQTFLQRLQQRVELTHEPNRMDDSGAIKLRVAIVGGGAGGVEVAFCLPQWIKARYPQVDLQLTIIHRDSQLGDASPTSTTQAIQRIFDQRGYDTRLNLNAVAVDANSVIVESHTHERESIAADIVIWATGAVGPPLLQSLDLTKDSRGFLTTDPYLRSVDDPKIFVVGDSGSCLDSPHPKAGVYAVRQGPVLWNNLLRSHKNQPLRKWRPQSDFLSLLNTGDGRAVLTYKGATVVGRWCWKLKDWIDRRFMDKHRCYKPREMPAAVSPTWRSLMPSVGRPNHKENLAPEMRCDGCRGKLSATVLQRVLRRLDNPTGPHVRLGVNAAEDVAAFDLNAPIDGEATSGAIVANRVIASVDFFSAFLDDYELVGRVAALNALSDLWAKGSWPRAALAHAIVPAGTASQQEQVLTELLAGSLTEFRRAGVPIVGGHTIEGEQTVLGFTILGSQRAACALNDQPLRLKSQLKPGDRLILTKPLGTGVLLAAHRQARCSGDDFITLLKSLLSSNMRESRIADHFQLRAATDVTDFGLLGHLSEMLQASQLCATINLDNIPLLPGACQLLAEGLESSLAPANRQAAEQLHESLTLQSSDSHRFAAYCALFDPQTSGGLLLAVPAYQLEAVLHSLSQSDSISPTPSHAVIGTVLARNQCGKMIAFE